MDRMIKESLDTLLDQERFKDYVCLTGFRWGTS